ncbi:MAG: hypothetical protein AAGG65_14130 [Pseudomonadota bacterium]
MAKVADVYAAGRVKERVSIIVSPVLAGQRLGIKEVDDGIWLISFMHDDLGYADLQQRILQPIDTPFAARVSPMSPVQSVTHVSRWDNENMATPAGFEPATYRLGICLYGALLRWTEFYFIGFSIC